MIEIIDLPIPAVQYDWNKYSPFLHRKGLYLLQSYLACPWLMGSLMACPYCILQSNQIVTPYIIPDAPCTTNQFYKHNEIRCMLRIHSLYESNVGIRIQTFAIHDQCLILPNLGHYLLVLVSYFTLYYLFNY